MGRIIRQIILIGLCLSLPILAEDAAAADLLVIDSEQGAPYSTVRSAMLSELSRLGFREGDNLQVTYWSLGNSEGMAKRCWLEEKNNQYDVIFLNGTVAARNYYQLEGATAGNTFVFGSVTDPIGIGLIEAFDTAPKANITGICFPIKVADRLRFIKRVMPEARDIGLVYADMLQSQSYLGWLRKALQEDEFRHFRLHYREVPFVKGEEGHLRMTMLAKQFVEELDAQVDLFLSPNDQMGVQQPFAEMVWATATKPLLGLGRTDVMEQWGATMSLFPSLTATGKQLAEMIYQLLTGTPIKQLHPRWPDSGMAFDLRKTGKFNISVPEELVLEAGPNIIR